jgi:tagaturonate epimerase
MLKLGKYSFGMGDRFAHQAKAQLRACALAAEAGIQVVPVWNKSNREHTTIGSEPPSVREAADAAVRALGWKGAYHVDADHINISTVQRFISSSDFFTIDVASSIGKPAAPELVNSFLQGHGELIGEICIEGIRDPFKTTKAQIEQTAAKYLLAVQGAKEIYHHIENLKGAGNFITEISMDETDHPQTPPELLVILAAIADAKIPVQTLAPKFTGRFNKGVDYIGNLAQFEKEFTEDISVIAFATRSYALPENLKLSVHSGSDKFSIYPSIRRALQKSGAGLHLKTAGTTWLEEMIGLAEAGGEGLVLAQEIYAEAHEHVEELCAPYAAVIDITAEKLPSPQTVRNWNSEEFTAALRHNPNEPRFNADLRQLLHVGYKIAAKKGSRYLAALKEFEPVISKNVTENLYERHLRRIFV